MQEVSKPFDCLNVQGSHRRHFDQLPSIKKNASLVGEQTALDVGVVFRLRPSLDVRFGGIIENECHASSCVSGAWKRAVINRVGQSKVDSTLAHIRIIASRSSLFRGIPRNRAGTARLSFSCANGLHVMRRPIWKIARLTTYASAFIYTSMKIGHFHPPVSRRTMAIVLMHCMASTNQASRLTATRGVQTGLPLA